MTEPQANDYTAEGFEIGVHVLTVCGDNDTYTLSELQSYYTAQLAQFASRFPALPQQDSERTHCIAWSGWAYQATVKEREWHPPGYQLLLLAGYAGSTTGPACSPVRACRCALPTEDGTMFDVYQATTQMTDESGQTYPFTIDALLSKALGPEGYYGVFTANMHSDNLSSPGSDAIIASAQSNGVPVVSGRQMLTWLDGRNGSAFESLSWNTDTLSFTVSVGAGANGLQVMLPVQSGVGSFERNHPATAARFLYTTETIKGVKYALFEAQAGAYAASYAPDTTDPVISNIDVAAAGDGTAAIRGPAARLRLRVRIAIAVAREHPLALGDIGFAHGLQLGLDGREIAPRPLAL